MSDESGGTVKVHTASTGASVTLDGRDIAAFALVDGVDIWRWAQDYANAVERAVAQTGRTDA